MKGKFWSHVIVLCSLLFLGVAGMKVQADPGLTDNLPESSPNASDSRPITDTTGPSGGMNRLYPEEMDPLSSCGVPLSGPFGKDVEVLLNGVQYELDPSWQDGMTCRKIPLPGTLLFSEPSSDLAAASLGTEKVVAAWVEGLPGIHEGELYYSIWDASYGWGYEEGALGLVPGSNPAILVTGGRAWEAYARNGAGQIQYRAWLSPTVFSDWETVPGTTDVASDPVVVSRRSGHTALFFRDTSGAVWLTEREGGVYWRRSPLLLTPHRAFLPVIFRAGAGAATAPREGKAPEQAGLVPSAFVSELNAISRNENHLAVFGVDDLGRLWVKEWTTLNASDWSGTYWLKLMDGVALEKPAVASRHSNHLVVAVRDTSGVAHTIEWAHQTGWGSPVSLGETFGGPLTLAATDTDELFLFGVDAQIVARSLHWSPDAGWEESSSDLEPGIQDEVMAAVVRRADDVMLFKRNMDLENWNRYCHYTSRYRAPIPTDREFLLPENEFYRNQVLAQVGSHSYYLAAYEGAGGAWKVEGWDLAGDVWQPRLNLADHPYAAGSPVSVVASDLDFDGSDEIVVATYNHPTATLSVLDLSVTDPGRTPTLSMVVSTTITETFATAPALDLSLATGDLDGDLRRNEVVLAATLADPTPGDDPLQAVAKLYQFVPGAPAELQEKSNGFLVIDNDSPWAGHWELETVTGRLAYGYPGEQLAVAISGERDCATGCSWMWGAVNTYGILTPADDPWTFDPVYHHLAVAEGDPLEFPGSPGNPYRSALGTGDLDADGYEEIAAWYLDRVYTLDPNDTDGSGNPTIQEKPLTPYAPGTSDPYFQSPRSLAMGDLNRDGRAEILAAAYFVYEGDIRGLGSALLEFRGDDNLYIDEIWSLLHDDQEEGTVLVGDVDGDGLVSELVGCNTFGEYRMVAVVNGLPRWYENGAPAYDSTGSYSVESGGGSSEATGTTYNIGASLTVGYEREINIPFVGTVASFRGSVTQDFLSSSGISEEREVITAFGSDYSFEEGLGIVVYNVVDTTCYYYDVFGPEDPLETSRAMSCKCGDGDTLVMTLGQWHEQGTKDAAGYSWADAGHRSPGGTLTNDLLEPGNYAPVLPVDDFMLLFEFEPQRIENTGGAQESWHASQEDGGARTEFSQIETNTTASVGATAGGVSIDASASFGMGWENSHTMSWSELIAFAGGYSWAGTGAYPSYWVAPYVYQATARTLAGITYPYWVMDYCVPSIGP